MCVYWGKLTHTDNPVRWAEVDNVCNPNMSWLSTAFGRETVMSHVYLRLFRLGTSVCQRKLVPSCIHAVHAESTLTLTLKHTRTHSQTNWNWYTVLWRIVINLSRQTRKHTNIKPAIDTIVINSPIRIHIHTHTVKLAHTHNETHAHTQWSWSPVSTHTLQKNPFFLAIQRETRDLNWYFHWNTQLSQYHQTKFT